ARLRARATRLRPRPRALHRAGPGRFDLARARAAVLPRRDRRHAERREREYGDPAGADRVAMQRRAPRRRSRMVRRRSAVRQHELPDRAALRRRLQQPQPDDRRRRHDAPAEVRDGRGPLLRRDRGLWRTLGPAGAGAPLVPRPLSQDESGRERARALLLRDEPTARAARRGITGGAKHRAYDPRPPYRPGAASDESRRRLTAPPPCGPVRARESARRPSWAWRCATPSRY